MLKRISLKADELASAGVIKKLKPISKISDDEVPAAYLAHCTFARLGSIANLQKGLTGIQSSTPGEFPLVVTSADRGTCDHFDFDGAAAIIPLVSSTGHGNASINRLHYEEGKFALGTILCAVFPFDEQLISARFLYEYLTAFKKELLVSKMIGTANVTLTLGKIAEVPVPILAPTVQRRVDELMTLCDQLEAAQQERERRRDRLAAASLQRLNQPAVDATPETQREHARFHLHHLPRLTTRPEHIKAMRQTFLNFAVQGRLLVPNQSEPPAAAAATQDVGVVLQRLSDAMHDDPDVLGVRFCLPIGWFWQTGGQVANFVDPQPSHRTPPEVKGGVPYIGYGDIKGVGRIDFLNARKVSADVFEEHKARYVLRNGDFVIGKIGTIGQPHVLPTPFEYTLSANLILVQPSEDVVLSRYLVIFFSSPLAESALKAHKTDSTHAVFGIKKARLLLIPTPPLSEQHRIVAKVDALMALCDQLEAQLTTTQTDSRRLLEAVLDTALTPA